VFIIILLSFETIKGKTIRISDYGAYPNDNIDDTSVIQSAIDDIVEDGSITIMDFGPGTYDINATIGITQKTNLIIKGQGTDQTLLLGHFEGVMLFIRECQNLTLTLFSIDFNPLPFTAGYVVDVNDTYLDIEVAPPHRTDVDKQVAIIFRYDPIQMRPAFGPNTYESYQIPLSNVSTSLVSPGVLRLPLTWRTQLQKGDAIVVRYKQINHAIFAIDITDMTIESINIYSSWMMGFVALRAKN
jgi:hypothetical protein